MLQFFVNEAFRGPFLPKISRNAAFFRQNPGPGGLSAENLTQCCNFSSASVKNVVHCGMANVRAGPSMKLLENPIPVSLKMTGIENDDYFPDGPNSMMEASRDEAAGNLGFAAPPPHPPSDAGLHWILIIYKKYTRTLVNLPKFYRKLPKLFTTTGDYSINEL